MEPALPLLCGLMEFMPFCAAWLPFINPTLGCIDMSPEAPNNPFPGCTKELYLIWKPCALPL